jgi:hypothetical protein
MGTTGQKPGVATKKAGDGTTTVQGSPLPMSKSYPKK